MVASVSSTPFTSFFASSFAAAIFSISCDFVICTAIFVSYVLIHATDSIGESSPKTAQCRDLHSFVDVLGHPHRAQSQAASSGPGAGLIIRRSRLQHPDLLPEGETAIGQKRGYVSGLNLWLTWKPAAIRTKSLMISGRSGRI